MAMFAGREWQSQDYQSYFHGQGLRYLQPNSCRESELLGQTLCSRIDMRFTFDSGA